MSNGGKYDQLIFDIPDHLKNIARYMWVVFSKATHFRLTDLPENPLVIQSTGFFPISSSFDEIIHGHISNVSVKYNLPEGLHTFREKEPLACAFYLMNSLHETLLPVDKLDKYERYPYPESIQYVHNLMTTNYVQEIFDDLYEKMVGRIPVNEGSQLMWSHDIDYLYSAWKVDLLLVWQKKNLLKIPEIIWKSLTTPHRWNNVKNILQLEYSYDIQSIFFWLTEKGKAPVKNGNYIDHADYSFRSEPVTKMWTMVKKYGSHNGLHKSSYHKSFDQELRKLPEKISVNRNHFLKFHLPQHYDRIEKSGLKFDASLGFAEHHGFRNSFGRPFQPFNLQKNRPYRFIELPLHLMDTTFMAYKNLDLKGTLCKMLDFIQSHQQSCVISVLLHNSHYDFGDEQAMELWHRFYREINKYKSFNPFKTEDHLEGGIR